MYGACTPTWERWHGQGEVREVIAFESTDAITIPSVPLEGGGTKRPRGWHLIPLVEIHWWLCHISGNHGENWGSGSDLGTSLLQCLFLLQSTKNNN